MRPRTHSEQRDASRIEAQPRREVVVELDYEFVHPKNIDIDFLVASLEPLRRLPLRGNVRVVVTGAMSESHSKRVDSWYSLPFEQERICGRVTAKTVTDQSSSTEILVDAVALEPNLRNHLDGTLERLLLHEGHHLVLRDVGEDAHACVQALRPPTETDAVLAWMGALAVEEYRIEASLCRDPANVSLSDRTLTTTLHDWYCALEEIGRRWGAAGCAASAVGITNEILTRLAYAAAAHRFVRPLDGDLLKSREWISLVGGSWPLLLELTQPLPAADVRISPTQMVASVRNMAALAEAWCEHIGFVLCSDDAGILCIQPLNVVAVRDEPAA